jgi:phosphoenolpyruvate carboxylase
MPPTDDPDAPLRADVHLLGELLGETIREREGDAVFETVERVRRLSRSARQGQAEAFETLRADVLGDLSTEDALPVARAFAHFLTLANIAEQHHRIRRRRQYLANPDAAAQPGSLDETFGRLVAGGVAPSALSHAVGGLSIGLVLTAHPTEVSRRTILLKHNRLAAALADRDRPDLTRLEREEVTASLRRTILELWETDEVRRDRPSALDEVRWGLAVFEQTLWGAVPRYLRLLDRALRRHAGSGLADDVVPVRFGSWMGGDRDGNPSVTAQVTWRACLMARWVAAGLYLDEVDALRSELSIGAASAELGARVPGEREPYRAVLRGVAARLRQTRTVLSTLLEDGERQESVREVRDVPVLPIDEAGFRDVLDLCHRSLVETGNQSIAGGRLLDIRRRLATFGLALARLDVRQDARVHDRAMDAVAGVLAAGGKWSEWDEDRRYRFLQPFLPAGSRRLPIPAGDAAGDEARELFETFRVMARLPASSLGAYVITMASRASDVLAILALQRAAGVDRPLRIVPLFETGRDLEGAGTMLRQLLALPEYRDAIGGRQEVMVGYSDSSKDIGRFAAGWLLYRAQEDIVAACSEAGVALTVFHGRGGSVGRGGGPTHLAIRALPPGAVNGSLRVTEQGEMIQAHWGLPALAVRTLEVFTTATLEATLVPGGPPRDEWRAEVERLAAAARAAYRGVVYEHDRFAEYFRSATPEIEIGRLNIGSRPARRASDEGVGSLRAIPWQFAWTQTRLLLASWLGLEGALREAAADAAAEARVGEMYREWPYFQVLLDLMEMVLAKADARIACEYDRALVPRDLWPLGEELRRRLADAIARSTAVTGHAGLLESNRVLKRSIAVRNPYVDPINLLQVELLRRLRAASSPDDRLWTAFAVTVNGIAAGMRNTG